MKFKVLNIELRTEKGNFTFANSVNIECNPLNAMLLFEGNNFTMLGETSYVVYLSWEDGTTSHSTFEGYNAIANLSEFLEDVEFKK